MASLSMLHGIQGKIVLDKVQQEYLFVQLGERPPAPSNAGSIHSRISPIGHPGMFSRHCNRRSFGTEQVRSNILRLECVMLAALPVQHGNNAL